MWVWNDDQHLKWNLSNTVLTDMKMMHLYSIQCTQNRRCWENYRVKLTCYETNSTSSYWEAIVHQAVFQALMVLTKRKRQRYLFSWSWDSNYYWRVTTLLSLLSPSASLSFPWSQGGTDFPRKGRKVQRALVPPKAAHRQFCLFYMTSRFFFFLSFLFCFLLVHSKVLLFFVYFESERERDFEEGAATHHGIWSTSWACSGWENCEGP